LCGFDEGHGKFCAVFAKLIVKGKNEGIHVFIVPIRNGDGSVAESVTFIHSF
jgi:acyl-CoA oxidase